MAPLDQDLWTPSTPATENLFVDINITPLTDIILVMLIIFMVSSSVAVDAAREGRLEVSLPEVGHSESGSDSGEMLVVSVTQNNTLFVEGSQKTTAELDALLQRVHARAPQTAMILDADGSLSHQHVVAIIERIRAAGFSTVHLGATER